MFDSDPPLMKLSKKAEYALRALVAMGRAHQGTNFSIQDLAKSESIPLKFLEQILLALKNGGMLRSKRGVGGGYQLVVEPANISLGEVVTLIDGPFDPIPCVNAVGKPTVACECGVLGGCALGQTLAELRDDVARWLSEQTVAHVIERESQREAVSFEI